MNRASRNDPAENRSCRALSRADTISHRSQKINQYKTFNLTKQVSNSPTIPNFPSWYSERLEPLASEKPANAWASHSERSAVYQGAGYRRRVRKGLRQCRLPLVLCHLRPPAALRLRSSGGGRSSVQYSLGVLQLRDPSWMDRRRPPRHWRCSPRPASPAPSSLSEISASS